MKSCGCTICIFPPLRSGHDQKFSRRSYTPGMDCPGRLCRSLRRGPGCGLPHFFLRRRRILAAGRNNAPLSPVQRDVRRSFSGGDFFLPLREGVCYHVGHEETTHRDTWQRVSRQAGSNGGGCPGEKAPSTGSRACPHQHRRGCAHGSPPLPGESGRRRRGQRRVRRRH